MSKDKLNKVAKLYTEASEPKESEADRSPASEEEDTPKKPSKKLDFNEGRGGMRTTIYKDKE